MLHFGRFAGLVMTCGIDKRVLAEDGEAIDGYLLRLLPVMRRRGGIYRHATTALRRRSLWRTICTTGAGAWKWVVRKFEGQSDATDRPNPKPVKAQPNRTVRRADVLTTGAFS